jgi:transketolase
MSKATREVYGEVLAELGKENKNIVVLDADLAKATKTDIFKKNFPDRFFDMGIAEADMLGTAAGLATTGKIPFASSFAVFAVGRAYDQIRNSIAYPKASPATPPIRHPLYLSRFFTMILLYGNFYAFFNIFSFHSSSLKPVST